MSKLIMQHMSKEPFTLSLWPTLCLLTTLLNDRLQLLPAFTLAWAVNAVLLAGYLHYVSSTILEICAYLNIKCFSIPTAPGNETKSS